jgi:uncharacterized protein (DUF433 family)
MLVRSDVSRLPDPLITAAPEPLGGTPVFAGTRVAVQSLIDYLEAGHPPDQFLDEFPAVSREHAVAVLGLAKRALTTPAAWSRVRRLLDGNLPRAFGALLPGHRVDTVHRRRWSDFDDRPLLDAAEAEYDALITIEQGLQFQQNLRRRRLRIVLIRAPRNTLPTLAPLAPLVVDAVATMMPGEFRVLGV